MNNAKTYSRTTMNNVDWELVETVFGGYALYRKNGNDYTYSGYSFRTMEDGIKHLDAIDERISRPVQSNYRLDCSSFYGRGSNVYYGD